MAEKKKQSGWIKIDRSIQDSWLWKEKPFCTAGAWIDLIVLASWHEYKTFRLDVVKEGELIVTQEVLQRRWGWSRQRTRLFLKKLENDEMITTFTTSYGTKITLCNYSKYQQNGTKLGTNKEPTKNQRGTNEEPTGNQPIYKEKEEEEEKEESIIIGQINFKLSFVKEKEKLFPMLDVIGEVRKCVNWHSSKGRKIKDWNRAVSNWLSIAYDRSGTTGTGGTGSRYQRFIKYRTHA